MPEVCDAIIEALACEYMCFSSNKEEFPHCIGAIDGKHIALSNPLDNGSTYFNYKGLFNIVLLALADADYKFIYVDIGCQGRFSDGGVFENCELYQLLPSSQDDIPPPSPVNDLPNLKDSFYLNLITKQTFLMLSLLMMHFLSPLIR